MLNTNRINRFFCKDLIYTKSSVITFFLFSMLFTLSVSYIFHQEHQERSVERFNDVVRDLKREIKNQMVSYEKILKDGVSIHASSGHLTQEVWKNAISPQEMSTDYPGVREIGMVLLGDGHISTMSGRSTHQSTISTPFGKISNEVFSDPVQRQAIERARDTGISSLSRKTVLSGHPDINAIMYYPVYEKNSPVPTIQEKRSAFIGFLYVSLNMKDALQGISADVTRQLMFELFDTKIGSEKNLLYRSSDLKTHRYAAQYNGLVTLDIGGETWSLHCSSTPIFENKIHYDVSMFVGIGGSILNLLLLWVLLSYINKRKRLIAEHVMLAKNDDRLQTLLTSSTDGIHIIDMEGNLVDYSLSFIEMLGYTKEEASHLNVNKWDSNFSDAELHQIIESVSHDGRIFETCHRRKDGTLFDVEITAKPIVLEGMPYLYCSSRNITERKKRQEELAILHSLVDDSNDMIFIIRIEDGYIEYANKTAERMIGYTLEEMRLIGVEGFRRPLKEGKEFSAHLEELKAAGSMVDYATVVRKDGSEFLTETYVRASYYGGTNYNLAIARDVTERENYKQMIENTTSILKEAQSLAKVGNWQLDLISDHLEWSQEVYNIFELNHETFTPTYEGFLNIVHPDDREFVNSAYRNSLEQHTAYDYVHRLLMGDGRVKYVHEVGESLYDDNNRAILSHGIVHDITENETYKKDLEKTMMALREREEILRKMNEHLSELVKVESLKIIEKEKLLMQQSKMAAMGEMVGMIAHQWRQPLNAVSAAAIKLNMLSEVGELTPEELDKTSTFIQQMSQKMSRTINDFMDFAKPDRIHESVNVKHILNGILKIIDAQLKTHNIGLISEVQEGLVLDTYKHELSHVLMNFLSNARDAFDDKEISDKTITIRAYEEGDHLIIEISDNAGGIEASILDRIFDPFFTTKSTDKGTGIGLYMSKKMIEEDLKGSVSASNTDSGALFMLKLPKTL